MKVHCVKPHELKPSEIHRWTRWQQARTELHSPFLSPEFTIACSQARDDVEVMLIEYEGSLAGLVPFQRGGWQTAYPVGAGLSEWQGVVSATGGEWKLCDLLASCGLRTWHFDHLIESQAVAQACEATFGAAPYMDLEKDFDTYAQARRNAGSACVAETMRKRRKLEREVGPVRFTLHTDNRAAFDMLLQWKANQTARTGLLNIFRFGWVVDALEAVWQTQSEHFAGALSTLHAGDQLAAVHLGPRSSTVAHLWFTAYDPDFAKYSPGLILLVEMARGFASQGVTRIDLGPGPQRYKQEFKTSDARVARGTVDQSRAVRTLRRTWSHVRSRVRSSPLSTVAKAPAHLLFQLRQWNAFRYAK